MTVSVIGSLLRSPESTSRSAPCADSGLSRKENSVVVESPRAANRPMASSKVTIQAPTTLQGRRALCTASPEIENGEDCGFIQVLLIGRAASHRGGLTSTHLLAGTRTRLASASPEVHATG